MLNNKMIRYGALAAGLLAAGVLTALSGIAVFLRFTGPEGPAPAEGLQGRYYNWAYSAAACPAGKPERYADGGITFSYFAIADSPNMQRREGGGTGTSAPAAGPQGYEPLASRIAGNAFISRYAPKGKAEGEKALKDFVTAYAEKLAGPDAKIEYGQVSGSAFSARFGGGTREGVCFMDRGGVLYCVEDPDLAMQRGNVPLLPVLLNSAGLRKYSVDDYAIMGLNGWLARPGREKLSECNYSEIKRTLKVL